MPVVTTTAPQAMISPSAVLTPQTWPRTVEFDILGARRPDRQVRLFRQDRLDRLAIELSIGLGARTADRRSLAAVEHAELDAGAVDRPAHDAVEGVDLAHQMSLGETADRGVAGHLADGRRVVGEQQRARAQARRCRCRLGPGMAAADDDDVEFDHAINLPTAGFRVKARVRCFT